MKINQLHPWNVSVEAANAIQLELKEKIVLQQLSGAVHFIAGADVSYSTITDRCFAAITVCKYPELEIVEQVHSTGRVKFPYVPGYLTFREGPILLMGFEKLATVPDLILFDGQGIAHPRKMGLAAHLGLILDLPSIGCAKSILIGKFEEPFPAKGSQTELIYQHESVGAVVRTREGVKPMFVSPGFKITINEAVEWVLRTCNRYRIPEPIRLSHIIVKKLASQIN